MPTVAELTERARKLELTGFSRLKKSELEDLINEEIRRREEAELRKIREADAPVELAPYSLGKFIPTQPLDIETVGFSTEYVATPRGLGISNRIRIGHYLNTGRKRVTPAMARRMRKHYNRGDLTVSHAALFPRTDVLPYL